MRLANAGHPPPLLATGGAARPVEKDLERFCDRPLTQVGPAEPDDDIAVVALRRR